MTMVASDTDKPGRSDAEIIFDRYPDARATQLAMIQTLGAMLTNEDLPSASWAVDDFGGPPQLKGLIRRDLWRGEERQHRDDWAWAALWQWAEFLQAPVQFRNQKDETGEYTAYVVGRLYGLPVEVWTPLTVHPTELEAGGGSS